MENVENAVPSNHMEDYHYLPEQEGVQGQLEGCNRNLRPKAAGANNNYLAPKYSLGQIYYTSLIILSKSQPNWSSSSRENAEKQFFLCAKALAKNNVAPR